MLIGNNGILTQAQQAKSQNEQKTVEEKAKLIVNYARSMDERAILTKDNLIQAISDEANNGMNVSYDEDNSTDTKVICVIDGNEIAISIPNGEIENRGKSLTGTFWNIDQEGTITIKDKNVLKENKKIYIPSKINGTVVTKISDDCFKNTEIEYISIPSTVTIIGSEAFSGCFKLAEIVIPCQLQLSIDSFDGCTNINKITIISSENSKEIVKNESMPWYKTQVPVEINIAEGITTVGFAAFDNIAYIENVKIPSTVKTIDTYGFSGSTGMKTITISEGLETINGSAFLNCTKLTEIILPKSIKVIQDNVFNNAIALESIYFRGSKSNVDLYGFWLGGCNAVVIENYNG